MEPFLSEIQDQELDPRLRLGSSHYLLARDSFFTHEERRIVERPELNIRQSLLVALTLFKAAYVPPQTHGNLGFSE